MMASFYRPWSGEMVMQIELVYWFSVQKQWKSLGDVNLKQPAPFQNVSMVGSRPNQYRASFLID